MKKFFADFKKFISRGNILDMAVGVIVGNAFSAIVTAFTNKIIMPLINLLLSFGGDGLSSAYTVLKPGYTYTYNEAGEVVSKTFDLASSIYIDWGAFITAILNFFIIAMTLFIILKVAMKSSELFRNATMSMEKVRLSKEEKLELKERGISLKNKAAIQAYRDEKKQLAEEKAKLEAEAKAKEEMEYKLSHPSQEELLIEIRDLLRANANKKTKNSTK